MYRKKGGGSVSIMFYLFVSETFNEFKGKLVHLDKKWLPFLNCSPPGVTGVSRGHCDELCCHLFMNNFLSYIFTICRVLWVISIWHLKKCLPYRLGKSKLEKAKLYHPNAENPSWALARAVPWPSLNPMQVSCTPCSTPGWKRLIAKAKNSQMGWGCSIASPSFSILLLYIFLGFPLPV